MSMIDVGMRLGDAIDPFHLANGFEAVIGSSTIGKLFFFFPM